MARIPTVDQDSCISCGLCVSTCPGVFRFNEDGKSEVYDPNGAGEQEIQQAIDGCPVQCISWKG
ncbi:MULTISPECIES: ferredoxin [Geobacter]|jgi:ferredoxin|uniref:ferredoxin n=1 Tax=Geobacter TaxID=28231 RepID=UPI0025731E11|nr:ferredoxin [Geobacter sulfurreducens]BEH11704.1 ferredoxin [Geobacter sulfurreducens subsp. ethanolicus]BET59564.1 ferredoxin [Geobacter sp. 60473]